MYYKLNDLDLNMTNEKLKFKIIYWFYFDGDCFFFFFYQL